MAIVSLPYGFYYPAPYSPLASAPALGTAGTLDANGEKYAVIFEPRKTGNIRKFHWRTGTVTTGDTLDIRVESVDLTTGDPSGSLLGTNTNVSHTLNNTDDNVWLTTNALTADAAVTKGTPIAIVIVNGATGNWIIGGLQISNRVRLIATTYVDLYVTGAWVKGTSFSPVHAIEYDDGTIEPILNMYPILNINTISIASNTASTTGDERGWKFQMPFSCRVTGAWAHVNIPGNTDADLVLYDSDGTTALATKTIDGNVDFANTYVSEWLFSSTVTLSANTNYWIVLKPASTTTMTMYEWTINSTSLRSACEGGANWNGVYRTDAGSWNDLTTTRMFMGLIIDGVDVSSGGVGGGRHHRHLGALTW